SNLLAALGRAQLSRLDGMIAKRRLVRNRYKELFAEVRGVEVFGTEGDEEDNVWLTAIRIDPSVTGWTPTDLIEALTEANIECRPVWKPMHLQPVFAGARGEISGAAEELFNSCVTLPSGSALTKTQQDRVL